MNGNLLNGYTSCFTDHYRKVNTYCPLAFKYKNMRKTHDRKQLSPYMQVVAACKFNECCNYHFLLDDIPVNICVIRQREFWHKCELMNKRHMIGDTHPIINEQLKKTTISDCQMTQYTSMSKNDEIGGNLTQPQTKDALRKPYLRKIS